LGKPTWKTGLFFSIFCSEKLNKLLGLGRAYIKPVESFKWGRGERGMKQKQKIVIKRLDDKQLMGSQKEMVPVVTDLIDGMYKEWRVSQ